MVTQLLSILPDLEGLYDEAAGDVGFDAVVRRFEPSDDVGLAELVEADGRFRLRRNRTVDLERYLSAVPDLPRRPDPLDAAIDMALRSLAGSGTTLAPGGVYRATAGVTTLEFQIDSRATSGPSPVVGRLLRF